MAFCQGLPNERCYMKRIAGLAALLGLVAAACSDSPTAPTDTGAKLRVATPPMGGRKSTRLNSSHGYTSYAVFFFNGTATAEIYTLSLHDALPICLVAAACSDSPTAPTDTGAKLRVATPPMGAEAKAAWYKSMGFEQHQTGSSTSGLQRSEERRVGKECRSRWSPYH